MGLCPRNHRASLPTVITQAEILYGIEVLPPGRRRRRLLMLLKTPSGWILRVFCPLTMSLDGTTQAFLPVARLLGSRSLNLTP